MNCLFCGQFAGFKIVKNKLTLKEKKYCCPRHQVLYHGMKAKENYVNIKRIKVTKKTAKEKRIEFFQYIRSLISEQYKIEQEYKMMMIEIVICYFK